MRRRTLQDAPVSVNRIQPVSGDSVWLTIRKHVLEVPLAPWWLLVCGPGKQQQISIGIFDDEILGAPRLLFQRLVKGNSGGLKF